MDEPEFFPDALEEHMREAFAKAAHLASASPLETAAIFINFALATLAEFSCGDRLAEELDLAAEAVANARAEAFAVRN